MSIESGRFLTMVTLRIAGLSAFPWQALVGALLIADKLTGGNGIAGLAAASTAGNAAARGAEPGRGVTCRK